MKKRYTEEKIITILKEHESGIKIDDLCRQYNIGYRMSAGRWILFQTS